MVLTVEILLNTIVHILFKTFTLHSRNFLLCPCPAAPSGIHAPKILMEVCGYTEQQVHEMYNDNTIIPIYWDWLKGNQSVDLHLWPGQTQSVARSKLPAVLT